MTNCTQASSFWDENDLRKVSKMPTMCAFSTCISINKSNEDAEDVEDAHRFPEITKNDGFRRRSDADSTTIVIGHAHKIDDTFSRPQTPI